MQVGKYLIFFIIYIKLLNHKKILYIYIYICYM
jgi:hypothetical protein